ncbi:unnamed protein product [Symbiodinium sp. CCMP2592]|nr:unnamed protein product [Symbiodinium sp. CCMP2592]
MGTNNRCDVSGLAAQWEKIESVRERVRGGGFAVEPVNPDGSLDASNKLAIKNIDVLIMILVRMADTKVLKVPDIEPLRTSVGELYALMNREVDAARIDDDAWALRHLAGFVKRKAQKSLVSLDPDFQDMCLVLRPELQELVDEIRARGEDALPMTAEEAQELTFNEDTGAGVGPITAPESSDASPASPPAAIVATTSEPSTIAPPPVATTIAPVAPAPVATTIAPIAPAPVTVATTIAPIAPAPVATTVANPDPTTVAPAPVATTVAPAPVVATNPVMPTTPAEPTEPAASNPPDRKFQLNMLREQLNQILGRDSLEEEDYRSYQSCSRAASKPHQRCRVSFAGVGRSESAEELVTPPPKVARASTNPDTCETQQMDISMLETPDFNKPERQPSTDAVDVKRWKYQHPNEAVPPEIKEADAPAPTLSPPEPEPSQLPPQEVFGRRQQMGLRKSIKERKKNKKNAVAEDDAEEDCAPKRVRRKGSKSKLKSRARGLKKLKSMKASKVALEEEEEEEQEQEEKVETVASWRDAPEVRARVKTSVPLPKCKAAAKKGKRAEKSDFDAHLDELAKEEPTSKASKGKGKGKRSKKDDQAEDGAKKPSGKAKKANKDAGEEPAPGKAKKANKDAGEEPAPGKAKKAKKDAGEEPASGRAKKAKKDAGEEPASGRAKKATKDAGEEPASGSAKKSKIDAGNKAKVTGHADDETKSRRPTKKDIEQATSDKDDVEYMLEYATSFSNTNDMAKLKKEVRNWLPAWTFVYPDIYWTTGQCGLILLWSDKGGKRRKTTVGSFSFGGKPTQLLVAISCSLLLVSCFDWFHAWYMEDQNMYQAGSKELFSKACSLKASARLALMQLGHNMDASAEDLPREAGPQKNREEEFVKIVLLVIWSEGSLYNLAQARNYPVKFARAVAGIFGDLKALEALDAAPSPAPPQPLPPQPDTVPEASEAAEPSEQEEDLERPAKRQRRPKTRRELLQAAARARLYRMVRPKKKRTDLAAPKYVSDRWNSGTTARDEMTDLLIHLNGDKDSYLEAMRQDKFFAELLLIVKRVKRFETKKDEGWYSEGEMKTELGWSPPAAAPLELDADKEFGDLSAAMKRSTATSAPQQANGRSVTTIEGHLTSMGKEYELINDQLAKGEAEGYSDGLGPQLRPGPALRQWARAVGDGVCALESSLLAPCVTAVRSARAVVEEVPAAEHTSIGRIARLAENDSEDAFHRLARDVGLALPVQTSHLTLSFDSVPALLPSAWLKFILANNLFFSLSGLTEPDHQRSAGQWGCFWERYKALFPNHDIFATKSAEQLTRTCALVLHGDEGRSKKKLPLMIISCRSVLGKGSHVTSRGLHTTEEFLKQELNMLGHTWATRFLLATMPRALYDDDKTCQLEELFSHIVADLRALFRDGMTCPLTGETYYMAVINIIGDWPFLAKAFNWSRTFGNSAKAETSKKDFESPEPRWRQTLNQVPPYPQPPALMKSLHFFSVGFVVIRIPRQILSCQIREHGTERRVAQGVDDFAMARAELPSPDAQWARVEKPEPKAVLERLSVFGAPDDDKDQLLRRMAECNLIFSDEEAAERRQSAVPMETEEAPPPAAQTASVPLNTRSIGDLKKLAKELGISLNGCLEKDDIVQRIQSSPAYRG